MKHEDQENIEETKTKEEEEEKEEEEQEEEEEENEGGDGIEDVSTNVPPFNDKSPFGVSMYAEVSRHLSERRFPNYSGLIHSLHLVCICFQIKDNELDNKRQFRSFGFVFFSLFIQQFV